jgi:SAM-dependent methyltransferase
MLAMVDILPALAPLLCDPGSHAPIRCENGALLHRDGQPVAMRRGIPSLAAHPPLRHRLWAWVYNRVAFGYDPGVRFGWRFAWGGAPIRREAYLSKIHIPPGAYVLETAVGTGENILRLPGHAEYIGMDISINMLTRCQRRLTHANRPAALVHADMHALPFRDNAFDMVYHMGGLQFVDDPALAVREMTRAAKPGATITLVDEAYSIRRLARRQPGGRSEPRGTAALDGLIPPEGADPHFELISEGELYFLSFTKSP